MFASSQQTTRQVAEEASEMRWASGMISKDISRRPGWLSTVEDSASSAVAIGYEPPHSREKFTTVAVEVEGLPVEGCGTWVLQIVGESPAEAIAMLATFMIEVLIKDGWAPRDARAKALEKKVNLGGQSWIERMSLSFCPLGTVATETKAALSASMEDFKFIEFNATWCDGCGALGGGPQPLEDIKKALRARVLNSAKSVEQVESVKKPRLS